MRQQYNFILKFDNSLNIRLAPFIFLFLLISCSAESSDTQAVCTEKPTLVTNQAENLTDISVTISGNISPPTCTNSVISQGFVYGKNNFPTIDDSKIVKSGELISTDLLNLEQNTTYFIRTFFQNVKGVFYGNEVSFTTSIGEVTFAPTVFSWTTPISSEVTFGVSSTGGGEITEVGVVFSLNQNPSVEDNKISVSGNGGNMELMNLEPNSTYYVRPFAINEVGLFYGQEESFSTSDGIVEFEVLFSNIKRDGFSYSYTIIDDGGYAKGSFGNLITDFGLKFSDLPNPSSDQYLDSSNDEQLTGLIADKVYYAFPYYTVNYENILNPIEIKTAPELITTEIKRIEYVLESFDNRGYYIQQGIDADVFIDTELKYIKEAVIERSESNLSPDVWWGIYSDEYNLDQNFYDRVEIVADGILIKEIGKGSLVGGFNVYPNREYKFRVAITDYSGDVWYSDYEVINVSAPN